jgi:hypothetical protein
MELRFRCAIARAGNALKAAARTEANGLVGFGLSFEGLTRIALILMGATGLVVPIVSFVAAVVQNLVATALLAEVTAAHGFVTRRIGGTRVAQLATQTLRDVLPLPVDALVEVHVVAAVAPR